MSFFENFSVNFNRYLIPALITILGVYVIIVGLQEDPETGIKQETWFLLGGFALLFAGIISILYVADIINKLTNMILTYAVMPITIIAFGYYNYRSVQKDLEFAARVDMIKTEVKQRLIDVRDAQVEFRLMYGKYAKSLDELRNFVKEGTAYEIAKEKMVPDVVEDWHWDSLRAWYPEKEEYKDKPERLTEFEAWKLGLIKRDTTEIRVIDKIFLNEKKSEKRISRYPFNVDSLGVAPFTGGKKMVDFKIGTVFKNGGEHPVFEAKWYIQNSRLNEGKYDTLMVGSMKEPTTNGNWNE